MRLLERYSLSEGFAYRIESDDFLFGIDRDIFLARTTTTSEPTLQAAQAEWSAAALIASDHLVPGADGRPTRNSELPDGTRGRLYIIKDVDNLTDLERLVRHLRREARGRDDIASYPYGGGDGRLLLPRAEPQPWTWAMRVLPEESDEWFVGILRP
jgi:hypothetical protein